MAKKIEITKATQINGKAIEVGTVLSVSDSIAARLLGEKVAKLPTTKKK